MPVKKKSKRTLNNKKSNRILKGNCIHSAGVSVRATVSRLQHTLGRYSVISIRLVLGIAPRKRYGSG